MIEVGSGALIQSKNTMRERIDFFKKKLINLEVFRYIIASSAALSIDYLIYLLLVTSQTSDLPIAATISYSCGIFFSYFLMSRFVFFSTSENSNSRQLFLFIVSGLLGACTTYFSALSFNLLVGPLIQASKLFSVGSSFIVVYYFRKMIVFKRC